MQSGTDRSFELPLCGRPGDEANSAVVAAMAENEPAQTATIASITAEQVTWSP